MNAGYIMTNKLEKTFFDTFGIGAYYKYLLIDKTSRCHNEKLFDKQNFTDFIKSGKDYLLLKVIKYYPQITDRILLELIFLQPLSIEFKYPRNIKELKNTLLGYYIEELSLFAEPSEAEIFKQQVQALFRENN